MNRYFFFLYDKVSIGDINASFMSFKSQESFKSSFDKYLLIYTNDISFLQKQDSFLKPLVDQYAKEGKDKKVTFEAVFSKPNSKPKWFLRKDVSRNLEGLFLYF